MNFAPIWDFVVALFNGPRADMKIVPHTATSAVMLWIAMSGIGVLGYFVVWPSVAVAQVASKEVGSLNKSMKELKASLTVERWERQIREMEDQLFVLSIDIDALKRKRAEIPVPMLSQVDKVTRDKNALQRKLDAFTEKNAALLEPDL